MRLLSVNLGVRRFTQWAGDMGSTGIDKRPTTSRVPAHTLGLGGDVVVDTRVHGGVDQAVYAYAVEDARFWAAELDREVTPGQFGENLTTEGLDVTNAVIGEQWMIGSAVFEVSGPRIPCRVFAGFWDVPDLIIRFIRHGAPGAYLRVLHEGDIGAGDDIVVSHRPDHGITNADAFGALTTEPALVAKVAAAPELIGRYLERLQSRVAAAAMMANQE